MDELRKALGRRKKRTGGRGTTMTADDSDTAPEPSSMHVSDSAPMHATTPPTREEKNESRAKDATTTTANSDSNRARDDTPPQTAPKVAPAVAHKPTQRETTTNAVSTAASSVGDAPTEAVPVPAAEPVHEVGGLCWCCARKLLR